MMDNLTWRDGFYLFSGFCMGLLVEFLILGSWGVLS